MNETKKIVLNPASEEQKKILKNIRDNIIVYGVAGCGKTTTILHYATMLSKLDKSQRILLLTYNKRLRMETKQRVEGLQLLNIEVHTYHSFGKKYYDKNCIDDYKMVNIIGKQPRESYMYHRIIIDEAQDMSLLYYRLVAMIAETVKNPLFMIMGDEYQSIFAFNGADSRYIRFAEKLFASNQPWHTCQLSTSYRLTIPMAEFINKVFLKESRIKAIKSGPLVQYIICNVYMHPFYYITKLLKTVDVSDVFILAPTLRSIRTPISNIANMITKGKKYPIYVPVSDEEKLDETVLKGKLVFSTFHQVKGLERNHVMIFGLDSSYNKYYDRFADKNKCSNAIYVALSRAKVQLHIFQDYKKDYIECIDSTALNACRGVYVNIINTEGISSPKEVREKGDIKPLGVVDLIRHLPFKTVMNALKYFEYKEISPETSATNICGQISSKFDGLIETVSEINGIALTACFEFQNKNKMSIFEELHGKELGKKATDLIKNNKILNHAAQMIESRQFTMSIESLLAVSNLYCAYRSDYIFKLYQVQSHNWITPALMSEVIKRMSVVIPNGDKCEFEVGCGGAVEDNTILGFIDIYDPTTNTIWEIKAVDCLRFEHLVQLAMYVWMANIENAKYKLFNILTGQIWEITFDPKKIEEMVKMIIIVKYSKMSVQSDEEFIQEALDKKPNEVVYLNSLSDYSMLKDELDDLDGI